MTRSSNAYSVPSTRRPPLVVGAHHPSYETRLATSAPRWAPGFMLMILGHILRPGIAPFKLTLTCLIWLIANLGKFSGHRPGALRRSSLRSAAGIHLPRQGPAPQWRSLSGRLVSRIGWRQTPKSPMPGHRGLFSRSRQNRDSRFPESGIPAKSNARFPGFRPNRDARFPEIRDSGQIGIQIRENPDFF